MEGSISRNIGYSDEVVRIRPAKMDDADVIYAGVRESLDELMPYMTWCHPDYALEDSIAYLSCCEAAWANDAEFGFCIVDAKDDGFLGLCGINYINTILSIGNLGYWVRKGKTGTGVATRATILLARFGFEMLGLHRIEVVVDPANSASRRVAEKTGATDEGLHRNRIRIRNESRDAVMYSLIPGDLG